MLALHYILFIQREICIIYSIYDSEQSARDVQPFAYTTLSLARARASKFYATWIISLLWLWKEEKKKKKILQLFIKCALRVAEVHISRYIQINY